VIVSQLVLCECRSLRGFGARLTRLLVGISSPEASFKAADRENREKKNRPARAARASNPPQRRTYLSLVPILIYYLLKLVLNEKTVLSS